MPDRAPAPYWRLGTAACRQDRARLRSDVSVPLGLALRARSWRACRASVKRRAMIEWLDDVRAGMRLQERGKACNPAKRSSALPRSLIRSPITLTRLRRSVRRLKDLLRLAGIRRWLCTWHVRERDCRSLRCQKATPADL